jgi:membrane associated rhomboid family serine protease
MPTYDEVRRWGLVLDAEGVPYDVDLGPEGPTLVVRPEDAERAAAALSAYQAENRGRFALRSAAAESGGDAVAEVHERPWAVLWALGVVGLLVAFDLLLVRADTGRRWFAAGAADSSLIRDGEWWRTVTALTLHTDLGHLAANVASGLLLLSLVFAALGPGVGSLAVLAAATAANLASAWVWGEGHVAVGGSTAVFAALGVLAGLALGRERGPVGQRRWGWAPLAAAVMLLVLMGLGPDTDIIAHVLGFVAGLPAGYLAAKLALPRWGWGMQVALACVAVVAFVGFWWLALARV